MKNERRFQLSPSFAPSCPSTAFPASENETSPTSVAGAVHVTTQSLLGAVCDTAPGSEPSVSVTIWLPSPAVNVPTP